MNTTVIRHTVPFRHVVVEGVVADDRLASLDTTWPRLLPLTRRSASRPGGDKQYTMSHLPLVEQGAPTADADRVPEPWREVARTLTGDVFRDLAGEAAGLDLTDHVVDVGIYVHAPGDGVSVHRDKQHKSLSCILYLTPDWTPSHGGALCLYAADDLEHPAARVFPRAGSVVMFQPGDDTWHAVEPVSPGAPLRRTVQAEFTPRGGAR